MMDDGDPVLTGRSTCPPAAARRLGVGDSKAKSVESLDASQIGAAPFAQISQGLFRELIKTARSYVCF